MKKLLKPLLLFLSGVVITAIALGGYIVAVLMPERTASKDEIQVLQNVVSSSTRSVYVAAEDIAPGTILTYELVTETVQYASGDYGLISANDIGKVVTKDIAAGTAINKYMLAESYELDDNMRLVRFTEFELTSKMIDGSYIDVRIRFNNGEDYVVLSKKRIEAMGTDLSYCYLSLTEEEIQMMASATTDAVLYDCPMYSTLYEEDIQDESKVTYVPNFANPALFPTVFNDTNYALRLELEERIGGATSEYGVY